MFRLLSLLLIAYSAFAQSAVYPSAVAGNGDLTDLGDRRQSTLSASMTSTATSFTVVTGSKFAANMIVSIDSEQIFVCQVSSNTVSVGKSTCPNVDGRGFAGTSNVSHASGALVSDYFVAYQFKAVREEIKAIETALGINLGNVSALFPSPLPVNKGGTNATTASGARSSLSAAGSGSNSDITALTGLSTPLPVNEGGTGAATLTGVPVGSGTSALSPVAAGGDLRYLRSKPNQSTRTYEFAAMPTVSAGDYSWSQTPGGTVSIGANTVTLTPCPLGVAASETTLSLHLGAGSGSPTPEDVLITGGTCTSGASTGTVAFTATVARTGSWTLATASAGIGEAWWTLSTGGEIRVPPGTTTLTSKLAVPYGSVDLRGYGRSSVIQMASGITFKAGGVQQPMVFINGLTGVRFRDLVFDGGFPNSTPDYTIALYFNSAVDFAVEGCVFRYVGFSGAPVYDLTDYSNTHSILMISSRRGRVTTSHFRSNFGVDIQVQTSLDITIEDNESGTPSLSDSLSSTNWWDTQGSAPGFVFGGTSYIRVNRNRIYGGIRFSDTWGKGGPIRLTGCSYCEVTGNIVTGLNPGYGTLSVTKTSGSIVGTNSYFSTLTSTFTNSDVGSVMFIEGDGTLYNITAVADTTHVTVSPTVVRDTAAGLRYQIATSGDLFGCSPCYYSTVSNNIGTFSGDEGLSLGQQGGAASFQHNVISNNTLLFNRVCGGVIDRGAYDNIFAGNIFANNHQGTSIVAEGTRGGMCLFGASGSILANNSFVNNRFYDDQGTPTQLYAFDVDTASLAYMATMYASGNDFANNTFSNLTGSQWNGIFKQVTVHPNPPVSAAVASGTTVTASGSLFHVTGTSAIATMNPPSGFQSGNVCAIADAAYTTTTAGNFAEANLGVLNETICYTYDPVTAKWYSNRAKDYGTDVASATTTALGTGTVFTITGTTSITTLNTCDATATGKRVTLIFAGILTFTDGNNLKLAGNFVTTADDSITLVCNGTNWYEVSRSVN